MASSRFPFALILSFAVALVASPAFAQGRKGKKNAPAKESATKAAEGEVIELPKLISTTGGGPRWKTLKELEQFANKGDAQACMEMGYRLLEGDGFPKDLARAHGYFEKAAAAGTPDAYFRLGKLHHDGIGVPADRAKGFEFYLEAAKRGVPEAQYNVGAQLASGRGVRRNFVEGLAWLIVARRSGTTADGEEQLRARMKSRPADIAAAEKRAEELIAALESGADLNAPKAASNAAKPATTTSSSRPSDIPEPPKIDRPTFQPGRPEAPKVTVPVVPVPPPALPGKP